jgi:ketosteroid isomerase-like protein
MEGLDGFPAHPARDASRRSMSCSEAGDRESWLALFADDAVIEDPIGPSSFDPEGKGHRGKDGIAKFWDDVISKQPVRFTIQTSYAAGSECANVGTVTTDLGGGTKAIVEGVFTYRVDDQGRIAAMRAYWEQDKIRIETAG